MNYYPHHIGDYRSATTHLSNDEDLAYRRLLEMYYDTEQPIPVDTQWVSRRIRLGSDVVRAVLEDFFTLAEDGWHHARCDEEIASYQRNQAKNRENGRKGGRPKNPVGFQSDTSGMPSASEPEPTGKATKNQEPEPEPVIPPKPPRGSKPAGVSVDDLVGQGVSKAVAVEFMAHRQRKRALVTPLVISQTASEAAKAGMTLEQAMTECIVRGWQGFKAEYMRGIRPTQQRFGGLENIQRLASQADPFAALSNQEAIDGTANRVD